MRIQTAIVCPVLAGLSLLFCTGTPGQTTRDQKPAAAPAASDSEQRKLEELLSFLRARNAKQYAISSGRGIDEASYVPLGGIEQWVTIRGQDRDNPVLLFLHGGPGDVTSSWSFALFAPWERPFTVVQWDQRGAGRTLRKSGASVAPTITVDRMAQDGLELAEYLRQHLGKKRITLVAHSFGTILGLRMVKTRPDLFFAYVGTGQVAYGSATGSYSSVVYDALLKKAKALGDARAIEELTQAGPPPFHSGDGPRLLHTWANAFEGADEFLYGTLGLALTAPGGSVQDINDDGEGQEVSAERLVPQIKSIGPSDLGLEFSIPIFVFQGEEDFTSPTTLARQYLESIQAPRKEFVPIRGGGHFAVFMHSDQFLHELVARVRPLAVGQ